jgi:hypothetical protein
MQPLALVVERAEHGRHLLNVTRQLPGCLHQLLICKGRKKGQQQQQKLSANNERCLLNMGGTCSMSPVSFLAASTSCSSARNR